WTRQCNFVLVRGKTVQRKNSVRRELGLMVAGLLVTGIASSAQSALAQSGPLVRRLLTDKGVDPPAIDTGDAALKSASFAVVSSLLATPELSRPRIFVTRNALPPTITGSADGSFTIAAGGYEAKCSSGRFTYVPSDGTLRMVAAWSFTFDTA